MKKHASIVLAFVLVFAMVSALALAGCGDSGRGSGNNYGNLTEAEAIESLNALLKKVSVTENPPIMDISADSSVDAVNELPNIGKYPVTVQGTAQINVEIFSSTEKASSKDIRGNDGWFNVMAEDFNNENYSIDGRKVSVSVRSIASGEALDYIVTGAYVPDAFSPANELWGDMAAAAGAKIEKVESRLVGNTAGILMSKQAYDAFVSNHGEVRLDLILDAAIAGELMLGYTNPYASSTGLNMLTAMLQAFDPANPLSKTASGKLLQFQALAPPVAYTTAQMRESAKNGLLDAMVMEYQAYINEPTLRDFVFTPFGVRHDSPVYVFKSTSDEQRQALRMFIDYCKAEQGQREGTKRGFNANDSFAGEKLNLNGSELFSAQEVWKENKDGGRPVLAVFVADISGSMDGTPINELRDSLLNASKYISDGNYVGLVSYDEYVYIDLPIGKFDARQKAYFNGAVKGLTAGGATATYDAVLVGLKMLKDKQAEVPNAKLMMFVLSDGEQNKGYALKKIEPVVAGLKVPIHTIGYNANLDELGRISAINEASVVNANSDDVVYALRNMFRAQM